MSREAMKQALEALESDPLSHAGLVSRKQAITALRQALVDADDTSQKRVDEMVKTEHDRAVELGKAYERGWNAALAQQEPVAWPADMLERIDAAIQRITSGQGCMRVPPDKTDPDLVLADIRKLIKSSQPASKPWVGLTDEEIHEVTSKKWWDWEDAFDIEGFSRAIEAKLREKNT